MVPGHPEDDHEIRNKGQRHDIKRGVRKVNRRRNNAARYGNRDQTQEPGQDPLFEGRAECTGKACLMVADPGVVGSGVCLWYRFVQSAQRGLYRLVDRFL